MNEAEWRQIYGVSGKGDLPLVTLIVISWNYAAYVRMALESAAAQDYPALEIIVLDNGSNDGSAELIDAFIERHPRVRFIRLAENLGQLGAAHHIFAQHRVAGDFVCFLDSDDVLFSHFVSHHLRAHLLAANGAAVSTSNAIQIGADGALIAGAIPHPQQNAIENDPTWTRVNLVQQSKYDGRWIATLMPASLQGWSWYPGSSNFYRREMIDLLFGKIVSEIPLAHAIDTVCLPFCHAKNGTIVLENPLSAYRCHGMNQSTPWPRLQQFSSHRATSINRSMAQILWLKEEILRTSKESP